MHCFYLVIAFPFIYALAVPFLYNKFNSKVHTGWFILVVPLLVFLHLLSYIPAVSSGRTIYLTLPWIPSYDINLTANIDGLSLIFSLIITGMGFLVIFYSIYYLSKQKEELQKFYIYLLLFMGSMLGLVFADNIFVLYVFWEMTSISSFLLIAYWFEREKSRSGARKSLMITIFGGLSMLSGFILLSLITDTHSIREMISKAGMIQSHSLFVPAMLLVLLGAFTKSAQFPFSIWLPDAMEAPTPVSTYLHSATMVKAGIYLVARCTTIFGGVPEWFWFVSSAGLVTLLYGSINAVRQTDLKALLAYSTVSQLGLIMSLLGLGSAALYFDVAEEGAVYAVAIFAAIFHLVNHSTFKGCLFMVVGIIDLETGTRDIKKLGGLLHWMPVSFLLALTGSLAMAGLPPFNGFLSKELFFTAVLNASKMSIFHMETWGNILAITAWVASVITFVYCLIILLKTFGGKPGDYKLKKKARKAPVAILIPPLILASLVIVIFLYPNVLAKYLLQPAWQAVLPTFAETASLQIKISAWHGLNTELLMTIGVVITGAFLYKTLRKWYVIFRYYPAALTLNNLYELLLEKMEKFSLALTRRYMTGSVRDYLVYILGFIILTVGGFFLIYGGPTFDSFRDASVNYYELGLLIGMLTSALTVLLARSRLTSVIAVGALGFLVAFFFVLFRAPDLALTQLVVETITTVLFLLCFCHLPKLKQEKTPIRVKAVNGLISAGVGLVMTILALSANGNRLFESISRFYENAYELAGAKNIVNAILVDFRGFDTMLEILVLSMAGLGVHTLIKLRLAERRGNEGTE
ncbi:MAG: Na+/H+ antiporter subunit A [Desulfitobacteriaceae bacterium]|nr:Na+/H+ antiporter subunit A [Desulfitobacteriaceae bacterium]